MEPNYLSILGLKLNRVIKKAPRTLQLTPPDIVMHKWPMQQQNRLESSNIKRVSEFRRMERASALHDIAATMTCELPAPRVSNAENVSIWWRHQANLTYRQKETLL